MLIQRGVFFLITGMLFYCSLCFSKSDSHLFNGNGYSVKICNKNYVGQSLNCRFSGKGHFFRVKGNIITGKTILIGGEMLIDINGKIAQIACHIHTPASVVTLDCPGSLISPGFINLHEHIQYSYQRPKQLLNKHWKNRDEWQHVSYEERGFRDEKPVSTSGIAHVSDRGMLRHLLSGTTAIAGAKNTLSFIRNLGLTDDYLGAPNQKIVKSDTFPLKNIHFSSNNCQLHPHSETMIFDQNHAYLPHVGEGVDASAYCETSIMLNALQDKKTPNAFIHAIALSKQQIKKIKQGGISVVLSPRSNFNLYGVTAPIAQLKKEGINLALSTDWSVSGSLSMLDEMRCFARYNHTRLNDMFLWSDIHQMVTKNAAQAVGLDDQLGELKAGRLADFIVINTEGMRSLSSILNQTTYAQIIAVFISGRGAMFPLHWKKTLPWTLKSCAQDPRNLCGQSRMICGANPKRSLESLLSDKTYQIKDSILCHAESCDQCR